MKSFLYASVTLLFVSCSIPKDPEDSLESATENGLRVGYVNNPPYCYWSEGREQGKEIELLRSYAKEKGFAIEFVSGSESELIRQLNRYDIQVLVGGFDKKTIWKEKAGPTRSYNNKNCLLVAKGENALLYSLESYLLKYSEENGY